MNRHFELAVVSLVPFLLLAVAGCGGGASSADAIAHDLTTPEGAILSLEDAYRAEDIEDAVKCRDFTVEATVMLKKINKEFSDDPEVLKMTADVLELGFRKEQTANFPNFHGIKSTFSDKKPYLDYENIVQLQETCTASDGTTSQNKLFVAETPSGWKVISVVED